MKIFIKKIKPQEFGYRAGVPDGGGKYLLIPVPCWSFFPDLSITIRNSVSTIRVGLPGGRHVGLFYVWNNTKFFPEVQLLKKNNERRLYVNKLVVDELKLDKDVIILFAQSNNSQYELFSVSISPDTYEYHSVLKLLGGSDTGIYDDSEIDGLLPNAFRSLNSQVERSSQVSDETSTIDNSAEFLKEAKKKLVPHLGEKLQISGDPLSALSPAFKNQTDFEKGVREVYKGKCAVRNGSLYSGSTIGLEAAHIHARYNEGNYLPSNGILLSGDLHTAFDEGIWTLSDELVIMVHEKVTGGLITEYRNKKLYVPEENKIFSPFVGYLKWHRENRFGIFTRRLR
jgi:hypothetical protein